MQRFIHGEDRSSLGSVGPGSGVPAPDPCGGEAVTASRSWYRFFLEALGLNNTLFWGMT